MYYWPNLFKEINKYVSECTICQTRSLQKIRPPLQETDIPPYPMAKLSFDLSGPHPTSQETNTSLLLSIGIVVGHKLLLHHIKLLIQLLI